MKYLILLLFLSSELFGQQELFHAQNKGLLLDEYPNAAAAYSLRRVNSRYTGPLIRVRKDSTGQLTQDIGTKGEALDTLALKAFAGTNSCYVSIWYDQSGNTGRDATQTTAANQPRIVNGGVIERKNNKVTLKFYNGNQSLSSYKFAAPNTNWAILMLLSFDNSTGTGVQSGVDGAGYASTGIYLGGASVVLNRSGAAAGFGYSGSVPSNTTFLKFFQYKSTNAGFYQYNNTLTNFASFLVSGSVFTTGSRSDFLLGQYIGLGASYCLFGSISEHIVYQQDLTTDRTEITKNINSFYAIY